MNETIKNMEKLEIKYCSSCGKEKISISGELDTYNDKTGKKNIVKAWKCPNAKKCHDQEYCMALKHEDKFSLFGFKCTIC